MQADYVVVMFSSLVWVVERVSLHDHTAADTRCSPLRVAAAERSRVTPYLAPYLVYLYPILAFTTAHNSHAPLWAERARAI